jgi:hypothetical protein
MSCTSVRSLGRRVLGLCAAALALLASSSVFLQAQAPSPASPAPSTAWNPWESQHSGTSQALRGIHAVGNGVAWASGAQGTVLRTEDSGYVWQQCDMPQDAKTLDFRSVWAWDAQRAIVMSSGPGAQSRLYRTTDGCAHWQELVTNPDPEGFWDSIAFSDEKNGYLLGDPVKGHITLLRTEDGGARWRLVNSKDLDLGGDKLGAFAASNQSLALTDPVLGSVMAPWFGTSGVSGGKHPFVYSGELDCPVTLAQKNPEVCLNRHWKFEREEVPMAGASESQGVFALGVRKDQDGNLHAVAVGGDYLAPGMNAGTAARLDPKTGKWVAPTKLPHGYRSSVSWDAADNAWIAVGTNGADVSYDDGQTWSAIGSDGFNAISLPWLVGPEGRIAKFTSLKGK